MPFYKPLKTFTKEDRLRTIQGIRRLRQQFEDSSFPAKNTSESLILGTWNIRNFDDNRFGYGPRLDESFHYIAEIIARFDILAVQEICQDLGPLDRLTAMAGPQYDYIVSDVTHSGLGGNDERLGFIYDRNKVKFKGVAGEIVLPDKMLISDVDKKRQFSRTPFSAEFRSGWFDFVFSTVHIYFGSSSETSTKYARRVKEINAVCRYLAKEADTRDANQILVGDFNIVKPGSKGFNALVENGFTTVQNRKGSNKDQTKFYDQISFRSRKDELTLLEPERDDRVFQFFDSVFRKEDFTAYKPAMTSRLQEAKKEAEAELAAATTKRAREKAESGIAAAEAGAADLAKYYEAWRTFQISDHLPLWVELKIDFSEEYLDSLAAYEG